MNEFQQQLLDHYHSPRNFGEPNFAFTHSAKLANLSCGDEVQIWLRVSVDGVIEDVSFLGEGCSIAIGSSSLLLELIKGKDLSYFNSLTDNKILELVGIPLTLTRIKCAVLSFEAAKKALS